MTAKHRDGSVTPIPTEDWAAITRNISTMSNTVVKIESAVETIKDDLLPPVAEAAKVAKEGVIRLEEKQKVNQKRLGALESANPSDHDPCEMVIEHGKAISAQERELAGLSKWRWWLMGIIVTAIVIAGGWATRSSNELTAVRTTATSHSEALKRHDASIEALEKQRQRDLEKIVEGINAVPTKVRAAVPQPTIEDALDAQPLTPREERLVREILDRARKRGNGG